MAADWTSTNRQILDALDIEAEYKSLGVEPSGSVSATGWRPCKVFGGDERNPSAGINVGPDHPQRGRYKEFTGEARNLSFFEFAALAGKFATWQDARSHYAKQTGIKLPRGRGPKTPEDNLVFHDYNTSLIQSWCLKKPPIAHWAVRIAGGRLAGWPAKTQKYTVIALPAFGSQGVDDDPVGWVLYNKSGRPLPLFQGKGNPPQPVKMLTAGGSKAGWMNKYALAKLDSAEVVWKVEGPADLLALQSVIPKEHLDTHLVFTNSGGSLNVLSEDCLDLLAGKTVYVIHDQDRDGQRGAAKWTRALAPVAGEVRHVQLPYEEVENHGRDLRDWLNEEHTYAELLDLAAGGEVVQVEQPATENADGSTGEAAGDDAQKDPVAHDKLICEAIKLDVLGELPDRKVKMFSEVYGKSITVDKVDRLSYTDLLQMCGPVVRERIHQAHEEVPNMYTLTQAKQAIAVVAGRERAGQGIELGQGCWRGKEEREVNSGVPLVLVGAGQAADWDGQKLTTHRRPRVAGQKVDMDSSVETQWYDPVRLAEYLELAADTDWRSEVINTTIALFSNWYWRASGMIPEVITGLVMATWVQSIWSWRPMISVTGPSDCGKTTLFETLETLFGPLALLSSKSTEAGIRQAVANHSKVILCDEFESDRHRKQILEFFRTSSRGSKTLRGTTHQSSRQYGLRHICWVTAVEVGLQRSPDRNRFIAFELGPPPADQRGKLELPPEPELEDLGQRLLAIAIRYCVEADQLARQLKGNRFDGVHGRVVESFSTPVAMLAVATGMGDERASYGLMASVFEQMEPDPGQATKDETELLGDILSSTVRLEHGEASVAQLLSNPSEYSDGWLSLERVGIAPVANQAGKRPASAEWERDGVFFATNPISRYLLKGTQWEHQNISQHLCRLQDAQKEQRSVGGHRPYGVTVPWEYLKSKFLGSQTEENREF